MPKKYILPERDFAFAAETFCLAGEELRQDQAIIARDEREGERAVQLDICGQPVSEYLCGCKVPAKCHAYFDHDCAACHRQKWGSN